jgi:bifunctional DNA-binding transcriptional regulator/antitoxin component of YhaV-PrlF toxin-antitoxin module
MFAPMMSPNSSIDLPEGGQVASVDVYGRVTFPADILKALSWWKDETIEVVLELVQVGVVRVFEAKSVRAGLSALRRDAEVMPRPEALQMLSVLADRYRPATLYRERRLQLTKELSPILGVALGEKKHLFAQPFVDWLELITFDVRASRLEDIDRFPTLNLGSFLHDG